jgi:hypothetical protein
MAVRVNDTYSIIHVSNVAYYVATSDCASFARAVIMYARPIGAVSGSHTYKNQYVRNFSLGANEV